jgi:hypothetical protein
MIRELYNGLRAAALGLRSRPPVPAEQERAAAAAQDEQEGAEGMEDQEQYSDENEAVCGEAAARPSGPGRDAASGKTACAPLSWPLVALAARRCASGAQLREAGHGEGLGVLRCLRGSKGGTPVASAPASNPSADRARPAHRPQAPAARAASSSAARTAPLRSTPDARALVSAARDAASPATALRAPPGAAGRADPVPLARRPPSSRVAGLAAAPPPLPRSRPRGGPRRRLVLLVLRARARRGAVRAAVAVQAAAPPAGLRHARL